MRNFNTGLGRKSNPVFGDMRLGRKRTYFSGKSPWKRRRAIDKYRFANEPQYAPTSGHFQGGEVEVGDSKQVFI